MANVKEVVLVILLCVSVAILFLDRSFFKEFKALTAFESLEVSAPISSLTTVDPMSTAPCNIGNNNSNHTTSIPVVSSSLVSAGLNKTDWFQGKLWQDKCMTVDHLCYSTGRWWYNNVPGEDIRQPPFTFLAHKQYGAKVGYPPNITVRPATPDTLNMTCPYSPLPNHLVLFSLYNEMLGEHYYRIIVGLNYILAKEEDPQALLESTQVYLHLYDFDRNLLESHHAFMAPFLTHQLLNIKELMQTTACTCVERLVLCGYHFDKEGSDIQIKGHQGFWPTEYRRPEWKERSDDPVTMKMAYENIRQKVILDNPFMQTDIANFRRDFLAGKGVKDSFDDWKIVGFAQRTGRRKWLNLHNVMNVCEKFRSKRIVCMEVNVEDAAFHPNHHVVVHGSLDALIGIHGAQMTEAIWMKPGSLVVEILTYLPQGVSYGSWTQMVKAPTPLGIIFKGTGLYHVGLPLQANSVPQCAGKTDKAFTECVRAIKWNGRDFSVDVNDVEAVIANFARDRPDSCDAQKELAGEDRFVLYNAWCDDGNGMSDHYFYWKESLDKMDKFSAPPS